MLGRLVSDKNSLGGYLEEAEKMPPVQTFTLHFTLDESRTLNIETEFDIKTKRYVVFWSLIRHLHPEALYLKDIYGELVDFLQDDNGRENDPIQIITSNQDPGSTRTPLSKTPRITPVRQLSDATLVLKALHKRLFRKPVAEIAPAIHSECRSKSSGATFSWPWGPVVPSQIDTPSRRHWDPVAPSQSDTLSRLHRDPIVPSQSDAPSRRRDPAVLSQNDTPSRRLWGPVVPSQSNTPSHGLWDPSDSTLVHNKLNRAQFEIPSNSNEKNPFPSNRVSDLLGATLVDETVNSAFFRTAPTPSKEATPLLNRAPDLLGSTLVDQTGDRTFDKGIFKITPRDTASLPPHPLSLMEDPDFYLKNQIGLGLNKLHPFRKGYPPPPPPPPPPHEHDSSVKASSDMEVFRFGISEVVDPEDEGTTLMPINSTPTTHRRHRGRFNLQRARRKGDAS
ncbi:hypothetical protein BGZ83_010976 [Gryganskiella cystojenkinii]|nr:hypothetical protein BGZ83_010976 [Gryganskiella cystojenkinii]